MSAHTSVRYNSQAVIADRGNYWRHYGLRSDPFSSSQEGDYYIPQRWEEHFDLLHYLCRSSNVLLMVTGAKRSGKTIFIKEFLTHIGKESVRVSHLLGTPALDPAHLIAAMTKDFALSPPGHVHIEEQLDDCLTHLQHNPELCLLTIDNAHRLPIETIRALLYLIKHQSENQMRLHIVLVGEFGLQNLVIPEADRSDAGGAGGIVHHVDLEPFSPDATLSYLEHRMKVAGLPAAMPFSRATAARIHTLSEGIPGRINGVASRVLIEAMRKKQLNPVVEFVRGHQSQFLGGTMLMLLIVFAALLWPRPDRAEHITPGMPQYTQSAAAKPVRPAMVNATHTSNFWATHWAQFKSFFYRHKTVTPKAVPVAPRTVTPTALPQNTLRIPVAFQALEPHIVIQVPPVQATPVVASAPISPTLPQQRIVMPVNKMVQPPVQILVQSAQQQPKIGMNAKAAAPAQLAVALQAITPTVPMQTIQASPVVAESTPLVVATSSRQKTKSTIATKQRGGTTPTSLTALLSGNPNDFTIQLVGLSTEQALNNFINSNHLQGRVVYYKTQLRGKDWFVLLYGRYPNATVAKNAIATLPRAVQALKPWTRTVATVQASVNHSSQYAGN